MDSRQSCSGGRTRKSAPTKNAIFVGAMHKERSRMRSRVNSRKVDEDAAISDNSLTSTSQSHTNVTPRQSQRMSTPVRACRTSPRNYRGRRSKFSDSDHDRSRSIVSSSGGKRKFHPNYDPIIEVRRAKERLERYNTQGDWKIDMLLSDDADEDLNKYEEKLKKRLAERGDLIEPIELERRQIELLRRQRDIDMGKVTPRYTEYIFKIPKPERERHHPRTPNKFRKVSRRAWDGMIRKWRKHLHSFEDISFEGSWRSQSTTDVSGISTPSDFSLDEEASLASLSDAENMQPGGAVREAVNPVKLTANPTIKSTAASSSFSIMRGKQPGEADEDEDTLQAPPKFLKARTTGEDEDTVSSLPDTGSPRRSTRQSSSRKSLGPSLDVLHSGLTNDMAGVTAQSVKRSGSHLEETASKVLANNTAGCVDFTNQSDFLRMKSITSNGDHALSPSKRSRRGILSQNAVCWPSETTNPLSTRGGKSGKE